MLRVLRSLDAAQKHVSEALAALAEAGELCREDQRDGRELIRLLRDLQQISSRIAESFLVLREMKRPVERPNGRMG